MGWLSKTWKSIKKAVKKVARTVKKVAKKVAHALPGGKALWKLGSKVGKGIMKGIGKVMKAIGPVGMIALSFVLGPAAGALWSSFGAMSAGMTGLMGTVTQGIFAAGNFVAGTLGAVGEAILGGAKQLMAGEFTAAASTFGTNMANALTGKAGMAAVTQGAALATAQAAGAVGELTVGPGINFSPATDPTLVSPLQQQLNAATAQAQGLGSEALTSAAAEGTAGLTVGPGVNMSLATDPTIAAPITTQLNAATASARGLSEPSIWDKTMEGVNKAQDFVSSFSGGGDKGNGQGQGPVIPESLKSAIAQSGPRKGGGTGSAGFSLLDPVRGLKESLLASQQMMFS